MGSDTRADAILTDDSISTLKRLARKHKGSTGAKARSPLSFNPSAWKKAQADDVKDVVKDTPVMNGKGNAHVNGSVPTEGVGGGLAAGSSLPADIGSPMAHPDSIAGASGGDASRHEVHGTKDFARDDGSVR